MNKRALPRQDRDLPHGQFDDQFDDQFDVQFDDQFQLSARVLR
jgi:hypothetical protein